MNMSYCRFQNTLIALSDCYNHLEEKLDGEEHKARLRLIHICRDIIEELGGVVEDEDLQLPEEDKGFEECDVCGDKCDTEEMTDGLCPDCYSEHKDAEQDEKFNAIKNHLIQED